MSGKRIIIQNENGTEDSNEEIKILVPLQDPSTDGTSVTCIQHNGKWFLAIAGKNVMEVPDVIQAAKDFLDAQNAGYDYSNKEAFEASVNAASGGQNEDAFKKLICNILFPDGNP